MFEGLKIKLGWLFKYYSNFKKLYCRLKNRKTYAFFNLKLDQSLIEEYNGISKFVKDIDSDIDSEGLFKKNGYKYSILKIYNHASGVYYSMLYYFSGYRLPFSPMGRFYNQYRWFLIKQHKYAWLYVKLSFGLTYEDNKRDFFNKNKIYEKLRRPGTIFDSLIKIYPSGDIMEYLKKKKKDLFDHVKIDARFNGFYKNKEEVDNEHLIYSNILKENLYKKSMIREFRKIYNKYGSQLLDEENSEILDVNIFNKLIRHLDDYLLAKCKVKIRKSLRDFEQPVSKESLRSEIKFTSNDENLDDAVDELLKYDKIYKINFMKNLKDIMGNGLRESLSYMRYPKEDLKDANFYNPFDLLGFQDVTFYYKIKNRGNFEVNVDTKNILRTLFVPLKEIKIDENINSWGNNMYNYNMFLYSKDYFFLKNGLEDKKKNLKFFFLQKQSEAGIFSILQRNFDKNMNFPFEFDIKLQKSKVINGDFFFFFFNG